MAEERTLYLKTQVLVTLPPDPEGINDDRAEWAGKAVEAFSREVYSSQCTEDPQTTLCDLLADLRHWADRQGIDFDETLRLANVHYDAETAEEYHG